MFACASPSRVGCLPLGTIPEFPADMHRTSPTEMMTGMKKDQKDAELNRKIEALRKKNEALMKRYQEVEEDKKRAEQEGMSLHNRKGKSDDLTITINKSSNEQRVVTQRSCPRGPNPTSQQEKEPGDPDSIFSIGRGKRRQLLVTTSGNIKGKRVFGERKDRNRPVSPVRLKPSVEEALESSTRVKRPSSTKTQATEGSDLLNFGDSNLLSSREEQLEYLRWKKEREEIDRERVARHKNAKGQWRRAWDLDKTDLMFSEKAHGGTDRETHNRARDRKGKSVPGMGSKAKGKDRLTGRATRCDAKEQEEQLQVYLESSLQEFLEELDTLCGPEVENINSDTENQDDVQNTKLRASEESFKTQETISVVTSDWSEDKNGHISTETSHSETSCLRALGKRVRFSEELIDGAKENISNCVTIETKTSVRKTHAWGTSGSTGGNDKQMSTQNEDDSECVQTAEMNVEGTEVKRINPEQEVCEKKLPEIHNVTKAPGNEASEASCPRSGSEDGHGCISVKSGQNQPVENTKNCSSRGNEDLIDSGLSVLSLESRDPLPDHNTSTDMARENGKVV
ncbi:coiled-coil domain-containing protein 9B-like isoform X2 [Myxocyprinus asiaticus]|uniref:coiled-coil domain-containing protein 9B-like isoform X2 n=1 Tax=Myxocyprinus asiaticus TaxID=70543 RepID=UPI002223E11F|nr:coiled-coil domain-containing protein 9B-like isoform X2 [Myxocyprinus asiaticus]